MYFDNYSDNLTTPTQVYTMRKIDVATQVLYQINNILTLKSEGVSNREIGRRVQMSDTTVGDWIKRVNNGSTPEEIAFSTIKSNPLLWGLPTVTSGEITRKESNTQDEELSVYLGLTPPVPTLFPTGNDIQDSTSTEEVAIKVYDHLVNHSSDHLTDLINDDDMIDDDTKKEVIKLITNSQKAKDKLRIERTIFRNTTRAVNAWEEFFIDLNKTFTTQMLSPVQVAHKSKGHTKSCGVIHFSDIHFNEEIDLKTNKFNFDIASKRIQKHVDYSMKFFKAHGVDDVVVAFTGDILNSDRRVDELLVNSTNRAKATFMAVDILKGVLEEISSVYNVRVATITGNESRINKDVGWVNGVSQDNFDYIISEILSYTFINNKRIEFLPPDDTFLEKVVDVAGQKLLLLHGHNGFAHNTESKFAAKIGQYATQGTVVDYIIYGHLHAAHISDMFARSSGLPGSNNYSQNALNLTGRSSQNFYIFTDTGDRHGMKVDLQNYEGYEGYSFNKP